MRKSRAETAESRARIVKAAAGKFREQGIAATGLADLMKAAGMTHGGFYKHFESKDQLVAEAVTDATDEMARRLEESASLDKTVAWYLSNSHRDHPSEGCPFPALGSELAHTDLQTRTALGLAFERFVHIIVDKLPSEFSDEERRQRALLIVTAMIGAITVARLVGDPLHSSEILRAVEDRLKANSEIAGSG